MPTGEIRARFAVDTAGLSAAEIKLREFEGTLKGLFKRDPGRRAEFAITQAVESLASGNVVGAIEGITSKMSLFGVIGGAATGLVVAGVAKLVGEVGKFNEAMKTSGELLRSTPAEGASLEMITAHMTKLNAEAVKLGQVSIAGKFVGREMQGDVAVRGDIAAKERQIAIGEEFADMLERQVELAGQAAKASEIAAAGNTKEAATLQRGIEQRIKLAQIEAQRNDLWEQTSKKRLPIEQEAPEMAKISAAAAQQTKIAEATFKKQEEARKEFPYIERARLTFKELAPAEKETPEESSKRLAGKKLSVMEEARLQRRGLSEEEEQKMREKQLLRQEAVAMNQQLPIGPGMLADRLRAQQAQRAEALGEKFRGQGLEPLAMEQFKIADQIKATMMPGLKQSEKPEMALKTAIDGAQVFQKMVTELEAIKKGVGDLSFTNK